VAGVVREKGVVGEMGHRRGLPMLDSTVDAVATVLAIEDIDETLKAGETMPFRSASLYEEFTFTVRSCAALLLEEKPVEGKVLLRTRCLMLLRLKPELLVEVLVELRGTDEFEAAGGDPGELDNRGEFVFDGSW
jgi:hypothetical protein